MIRSKHTENVEKAYWSDISSCAFQSQENHANFWALIQKKPRLKSLVRVTKHYERDRGDWSKDH